MKFDVVIFIGSSLMDFAEPGTPVLRFNDVTTEEMKVLASVAERQNNLFVCCLPLHGRPLGRVR